MLDATQHSEGDRDGEWYSVCNELLFSLRGEGEVVRPQSRQGYRGFGAGNCFCGTRPGGDYLHLGGARAGLYFSAISRYTLNYPRIDIQVTVKQDQTNEHVGKRELQNAIVANSKLSSARQRDIRHMEQHGKGFTLYIGSPKSDQMGRIYDKYRESGLEEYKDCWRWEIQLRNKAAKRAALYLMNNAANEQQACIKLVFDWFSKRGCQPDFAPGELPDHTWCAPKEKSDVARTLQWLYTGVEPAVRRLIDAGYLEQVLEALGLSQGF